ncbi:DUF4124 domain-containing protein [Agrilutibacter solisilvae]|uniref:DUF4124 domain-containing protein n=1 Tax=Agrilutibacter solisilvae TaxID=2763317 RepID=A0A974Y1F3_9GAMM|nr:DUF4124 domain-containing protein [Lysobacter solisilvae]QSX78815.1 DUF4124 domain-containing protein [Lysobacter solisilvae]
MTLPEGCPVALPPPRRPRRWRHIVLGGLACIAFGVAATVAQSQVVIYRCTDAKGALTIQNNVPCPKGSRQNRRVMETPPAAESPFVPMAAPPTVAEPAPPPPPPPPPAAPARPSLTDELGPSTVADADRLPPPVLYECRTYDDDRYLSENGNPAPRCATLATTALGGYGESGSGAACEMKTDSCQRVADGALCEAWRRRLREAESSLRFGASQGPGPGAGGI